jgi:hypothetical protein
VHYGTTQDAIDCQHHSEAIWNQVSFFYEGLKRKLMVKCSASTCNA